MIETLVVFGAGGDLAARLLIPGVAALRASGDLPDVRVIGADLRDPAVEGVEYLRADVTDAASVAAVLDAAGGRPVAVYLALPTDLLPSAIRALRDHGLPAGSRLAIEKPFGQDADSAASLNALLREVDGSDEQHSVYRVDHTLAVPDVARLASALPADVTGLEVLFEETLALEGRAGFYDRAGALRDVMQNHQVQLLCTIAGATDSASRAAVLRSVRVPSSADVRDRTRRARYTAGTLAGRPVDDHAGRSVPDYADEDGVDPGRGTETFAEVALGVDLPALRDVRVLLRAGKALDARRRGVLVHRRDDEPLWLDIDETDGTDEPEPVAYRRIVADLLGGGSSFCVSAEETELAWRIFMPVLDGWASGVVPLQTYPAGSRGPAGD